MAKSSSSTPRASRPGSLAKYNAKRDFGVTPEPSGKLAKAASRLRFVVQMHHASRLHYDFRLEADGVLASWAVPKGPTLATGERRLAMHVEDHPMNYRDFEGTIPSGQYGAGSVIVWDSGTYELAEGDDPATEIANGKIKFIMHGKKLQGVFALVRIKPKGDETGDPWLLIKDHDAFSKDRWDVTDHDKSVKSGKTLKEIADDPRSKTWQSKPKASAKAKATVRAVKHDPIPHLKALMLATVVDDAFDNDDWLFEIKWDGYRALCTVDEKGKMTLVSRNGLDLLKRFPELADLPSSFASVPIVVDGEIVSLDSKGRSSFQRLQDHEEHPSSLTYVAFDLLYADGKDLRKTPLEERKALLERLIVPDELAMYSKHVIGKGNALFDQAQRSELEGIIGKLRTSTYQERRTREWVKIKALNEEEFVIGGWTEPRGSRKGFGALLLGMYEGKKLRFVGNVGTGFSEKSIAQIHAQLVKIERAKSPFANEVVANASPHYVTPKLIAQVRFAEWTRDGILRQPSFLGLRIDKEPAEVRAPVEERAPSQESATAERHVSADRSIVKIGTRSVSLSNPQKVLFPRDGITKSDLVGYYRAMAEVIVPHLEDRPLTVQRYPNGIDGESFFEKHLPKGVPDWVDRVTVRGSDGHKDTTFIVCNDEASLAFCANLASIVLHVWTSRVETLDEPEFVFFDLDPGDTCSLKRLATVALTLRDRLAAIGLSSLVKTSGGYGLHVAVPLQAGYSYETVKHFAELGANEMTAAARGEVTLERMIKNRDDAAVYLDYVQVGRGKTMVAPYSVRARDGAPVSMPLEWDEVEAFARKRTTLAPADVFAAFTIRNAPKRIAANGDLWGGKAWKRQRLEPALAKARKAWLVD